MAKVLNLDAFASKQEERKLIINGVSHVIVGMTVENFIETTKAAERISGDASIADQVEATMDMIQRSVPTVGRDLLSKCSLDQLQAITAFVRGDNVDEAETEGEQALPAEGEVKK